MAVYVALVRAIGPVTHARMGMSALREACEEEGLAEVMTIGNTGNLIFRSEASLEPVREIAQRVVNGFGLDNEVFVRSPSQMDEVVRANPFAKAAAERPSEVGVCAFHVAPDWRPLTDYVGPEEIAMVGAHLIVAYPAGITGSRLQVEKRLGATMTQRNWKVFAALAAKAGQLKAH